MPSYLPVARLIRLPWLYRLIATDIIVASSGSVASALYEYLITFEQEITAVWHRKMNVSSALLLSVRWTMVGYAILYVVPGDSVVSALKKWYRSRMLMISLDRSTCMCSTLFALLSSDAPFAGLSCRALSILAQTITLVTYIQTARKYRIISFSYSAYVQHSILCVAGICHLGPQLCVGLDRRRTGSDAVCN